MKKWRPTGFPVGRNSCTKTAYLSLQLPTNREGVILEWSSISYSYQLQHPHQTTTKVMFLFSQNVCSFVMSLPSLSAWVWGDQLSVGTSLMTFYPATELEKKLSYFFFESWFRHETGIGLFKVTYNLCRVIIQFLLVSSGSHQMSTGIRGKRRYWYN